MIRSAKKLLRILAVQRGLNNLEAWPLQIRTNLEIIANRMNTMMSIVMRQTLCCLNIPPIVLYNVWISTTAIIIWVWRQWIRETWHRETIKIVGTLARLDDASRYSKSGTSWDLTTRHQIKQRWTLHGILYEPHLSVVIVYRLSVLWFLFDEAK